MDNESLACLVERANKGDLNPFAKIYSELYESVYYIGLKITGNQHDAGDEDHSISLARRCVTRNMEMSL